MIVQKILYSPEFVARLKQLPKEIIKKSALKENLFRSNPLHPSLRLHALHGRLDGIWSISINIRYRILFKRKENGDIVFFSIGKHDLYKHFQ